MCWWTASPAHVLMSRPGRLGFPGSGESDHGTDRGPQPSRSQQHCSAARGAPADRRAAPGNQPRREPLGNDLCHDLRPARQADAGFSGARQPGWARNAVCHRHSECHRTCIQCGRRSFCDLARRGQCVSHRRGGRVDGVRRRHGRGHGRGLRPRRAISLSATAAERFSRSIRSGRSLSMPRWSRASPLITWLSDGEGTLYVTGPTLSSNDSNLGDRAARRHARRGIADWAGRRGSRSRKNGDVYVAACLHGRRGLVRVTPAGEATLVLAGINLVAWRFRRWARPFWPRTKPFMMWIWAWRDWTVLSIQPLALSCCDPRTEDQCRRR